MMKKLVLCLCAAGMVFGVATEGMAGSKGKVPLAKQESYVFRAHDAIKLKLKYPESAEFKCDVSSSASNITGFVNAKNDDGQYTGFKQFNVIFGPTGNVVDSSIYSAPVPDALMNGFCNASEKGMLE